MGQIEDAIKKYEEDPDFTIYYGGYDNIPNYAINNETGEIVVFQYGYFGHIDGKTMNDLEEVDCSGNISKKYVFEELDSRIESLIGEYNRTKVNNYRGQNDSTLSEYCKIMGRLDALMDLREELMNDIYW